MKTKILLLLSILLACNQVQEEQEKENWISLFNGKDLSSWDIKFSGQELNDNYKNTFRVEDGVLKISYAEYEEFDNNFGHLFYNQKFSYYKLRVEYRFVGEQTKGAPDWAYKNNGVMFHSQSAQSMGIEQNFPVSIEAQLLGGSGQEDRPTGNLATPGTQVVMNGDTTTNLVTNSSSKTYHGEEWITMELVVLGDSIIHHIIDSDTVLTYSNPHIGDELLPENYPLIKGTPLKDGFIALQAESHPTEFRKIELLDLSEK